MNTHKVYSQSERNENTSFHAKLQSIDQSDYSYRSSKTLGGMTFVNKSALK